MGVTEKQRHAFLNRAIEVFGTEHDETMMELLPPSGWDDVATKRDLDALGAAMKEDLIALELRMEQRFNAMTKTYVTWLLASQGAVVAAVGVLFAALG